ncbi:MAG: hypothetical protein J6P84_03555 [Alphaproteobacteria bacterium]|nr:hypothetical protein [Alphaproteobacteria bacterium]
MALAFQYDFNFKTDKTNKFITIVFGFLIYCMSITFMSGIFTYSLTNNWDKSLNGQLTVEFPSYSEGTNATLTEKQLNEVTRLLQETNGVLKVRKLKEADILKILEPWLNSTAIPDDFPFPVLFDVEVDRRVDVDLLGLSSKLMKISQGVRIHNHANWYASIAKISKGLFGFSVLLAALILLTVCSTIIFIIKKTLSNHRDVVKILQLIGARNKYIATQFKRYYFSISLKGAWISLILSIMTILGITYLVGANWINLDNIKYLGVSILVSVIVIAVVMITSQNTVLYFLKNEDWLD